MWYDTVNKEWIENEQELNQLLCEIAGDNRDYFNVDDVIDTMYQPFEMFSVKFYPSEIIKKLDEMLYDEIQEDIMSDWIEDVLYRLNRVEPEEEDSLAEVLDEGMYALESIVWKEQE